jgi:hypothetical protein
VKALAYAVLALAAVVCVFFVSALQPTSTGVALALAGWLMLPYALLALGVALGVKDARSARAWLLLVVLVCAGGAGFLALTIFGPPDAQGGIAVMFTPIYQAIGAIVLLPACLWFSRHRARAPE